MKITIEPYSGGEFTASNDAEYIGEVITMFRGLLVQAGYHPETVDSFINDGESWFPDKDKMEMDGQTRPYYGD